VTQSLLGGGSTVDKSVFEGTKYSIVLLYKLEEFIIILECHVFIGVLFLGLVCLNNILRCTFLLSLSPSVYLNGFCISVSGRQGYCREVCLMY
jgi:hypothetical protein